jgi:hypothetical protein
VRILAILPRLLKNILFNKGVFMKSKILLFAVIGSFCFLSKISYSQAPAWLWAKSAGGTYSDIVNSIAVDASGNTYVAGYFYSPTLTFGSTTLTNIDNTGNTTDIFLAKLGNSTGINESGNPLKISVFPNPSNGKFTITFPSTAKQI